MPIAEHLLNTYNPLAVSFTHGEGAWLYDQNNKKYLDALCGIAVTGLGHNHPSITPVIQQQAKNLIHISNLVTIPQQIELADRLIEASQIPGRIFFSNSGAEAVETALKLVRLYGHSKNIDNPKVVVMEDAFHGRTLAALSASGNRKVQAGFEPLVQGFVRAAYQNIDALATIAKNQTDVVAVLLEPIQGEGGIIVPPADYLAKVREICDQNKWLMIVDEIQTGMGRTGKLFAFEHANIIPDAMTLAKGLANGVPIGACVIREPYTDLFKPGSHGSTFGGNPLSCAVGLATLNEIIDKKLWENAAFQGDKIKQALTERLADNPHVVKIKGQGLMLGIELDKPCRDILPIAFEHGLVFNITKEKNIRLLPPLILTDEQTNQIIELVPKIIEKYF